MRRRLLTALAVLGILLLGMGGSLWWLLTPPTVPVAAPERLVLPNVTVINPGRDRHVGQTLTIDGGRIVSITAAAPAAVASARTSRFAGTYLLPGLIDMHVHVPPAPDHHLFALLFLAHGVTSVRDTGNFDGRIWDRRRAIRAGAYPGPRIFACGPLLDGVPPLWRGARVVPDAAAARVAVAERVAEGADCVKVYSNLSPEALAAIRTAAAAHGLPVIGHVPRAVPFDQALLADVQHLTGVAPHPAHLPGTLFAELSASWQTLEPDQLDLVVRTSLERGIAHTPTLVLYARLAQLLDPPPPAAPAVRLLPRYYRDVVWSPQAGLPYLREAAPASVRRLAQAFPTLQRVVARLYQAGVRLHVGTDTPNPFVVPGVSMHEEMQYLVDAGLPPEAVWAAATWVAGAALREPHLGLLAPDSPADVLIFRQDPVADLQALATLEGVVAQGRLYPKEMLDAAVARHQRHFTGRLYEAVTLQLMRWLLRQP